jgi:cytoskeletal protein CcmA (bactofilin family)
VIRKLATLALVVVAVPLSAQRRADYQWANTLAAGSTVSVRNISGDVRITPSTSGRVEVLGYKNGSARGLERLKADVQQTSRGIVVCVLYDDNTDCDNNHSSGRRSRWDDDDYGNASIDFEVAVPANLVVDAGSVSGDVSVNGAHGDVRAASVSGDVRLEHLHASSIDANSVSGDVDVSVDEITGRGDFKFHSVSGDVTLEVPRDFSADLSMTTVSGDINSDFPITIGGNGRMSRRSVEARIGSGGRRLDVNTVSGDLRIRTAR